MPAPLTTQVHYKIGDNDNADGDLCSFDALDTIRINQPKKVPFMVRIQATNSGGGSEHGLWALSYNNTDDTETARRVGDALDDTGKIEVKSVSGLPTDGDALDVDDVVFDNTGSFTFENGLYDDIDGNIGKLGLDAGNYTDLQFCVQFTDDAQDGAVYYFFLGAGASPIDSYDVSVQVRSEGFIEQALYSLLTNESDVTDLVGTRIYPNIVQQGAAMPAMTYEQTEGTRDEVMTAPTGFVESSFQLTYYSDLYSEVRAVAVAVESLFDGYSGTVLGVEIEAIHLVDEADVPIMPADKDIIKRYGKRHDFTVWFKELV